MRIFGADRIQGIMGRLGMEEGEPIEHGLVTRAIENAQKKSKATTLISVNTCWNMTTCSTSSAK
jgi:preprotein translocase subunit SecA